MKLLYFANSRIPTEKAHGVQLFKMCESFANQGAEVELVVPGRLNRGFKKINPFDYYRVSQNFKIVKLFSPDPHFLTRLPQGTYIKFQALFFIIWLFFYLLFKPKKKDYVFYVRHEYLLPLLNFFSKRVCWEAHNLPRKKELYVKSWRRCHRIFAITQGLKDELISLGISAEKIFISPDGVDIKEFNLDLTKEQARKKLSLPLDKKLVVYAGHLYEWKGADVLAAASEFLDNSHLIVFVGGTDFDLKRFRPAAEFYQNIFIVGQQSYKKVPEYLKAADVLVLPNSAKSDISKRYTSPMKMFEYMVAGRPIVASDLPSIREVLNQDSAVLVKPDDPKALAAGIDQVLKNQKLSEIISKRSFELVQNYTWNKRAEKIISKII